MSREAMQQALDALYPHRSTVTRGYTKVDQAIDALRAALAQPVQHAVLLTLTQGVPIAQPVQSADHNISEGYRIVPLIPTEAMLLAACDVHEVLNPKQDMINMWQAMCLASPKQAKS